MDPIFQVPIAILFFTALDFTFTTRYIHKWVSFPLWPNRFILSGTICNCPPLFPSSILDIFWPGGFIFWCHIFLPFCTVHGVFMARILEWFAFLSPVGHLLSELFTMTHPSLGALHGTAHRFTELHKPLHHIMWCDPWRVTSLLLRDFSETWCSLWSFVCVCAKLLSHAQVKQEDLDEVNFQIIIFSYNGSNTATIKF